MYNKALKQNTIEVCPNMHMLIKIGC